ncbi:hypothetical protein Tco_1365824 [Tanacetum coccineum]
MFLKESHQSLGFSLFKREFLKLRSHCLSRVSGYDHVLDVMTNLSELAFPNLFGYPTNRTNPTGSISLRRDIIVNGDLEDEASPLGEQSSPLVPKTTKQLAARRNQERIKSILLLAIPDEYLLKFHNVPDAKSCGVQ